MKYIDSVEVYGDVYEIRQVTTVDKFYGFQTKFTVDINGKTHNLKALVNTDVLEALKFASYITKDISDNEIFVRNELQQILSVEISSEIINILSDK